MSHDRLLGATLAQMLLQEKCQLAVDDWSGALEARPGTAIGVISD